MALKKLPLGLPAGLCVCFFALFQGMMFLERNNVHELQLCPYEVRQCLLRIGHLKTEGIVKPGNIRHIAALHKDMARAVFSLVVWADKTHGKYPVVFTLQVSDVK